MSTKHYPVTPESSRSQTAPHRRVATSSDRRVDARLRPPSVPVLVGTVVATTAIPMALAYPGVVVALAVLAVGALIARRD